MKQIKINGTDIRSYGATVCKGFYEALLTPPAMKSLVSNTSRLIDGTRLVDIAPRYAEREITLTFFITAPTKEQYLAYYNNFINAITAGKINLEVEALGATYKIVYLNCQQYGDYGQKSGKFAIRFLEPNPTDR